MTEEDFYGELTDIIFGKNLHVYMCKEDNNVVINALPYSCGVGTTLAEAMINFKKRREEIEKEQKNDC